MTVRANSSLLVILVVENDDMLRARLAERLAGLGYFVLQAPTAEAAQDLFAGGHRPARWPIDVLFTDIALGSGMNGVELAAWAREHYPRTHVIYTTGSWDVSGLDGPVLRKPYSHKDLDAELRRLMEV